MKRVYVLVEGQTEETFVRDVLAPHLLAFEVALNPVVAATRRVKSGRKFRGGVTSYRKLRRDLVRLLGDTGASGVTTMIDYYGLPRDFPGFTDLPPGDSYRRVSHLQSALGADVGDPRFFPYLSLHELEALLLVSPQEIEARLSDRGVAEKLTGVVQGMSSPEQVNDGKQTHPAARITDLIPRYRKPLDGPVIAKRIGLQAIREECPHFGAWVAALEALA